VTSINPSKSDRYQSQGEFNKQLNATVTPMLSKYQENAVSPSNSRLQNINNQAVLRQSTESMYGSKLEKQILLQVGEEAIVGHI